MVFSADHLVGEASRPAQPAVQTLLDEARRALARELHDSVAQTLATMLVELENFKAAQGGRQSVLDMVSLLQESTRAALNDLRQVLFQLRGTGTELNLPAAVRALARSTANASGLRIMTTVAPTWPQLIPTSVGIQLFRMVEEALTNSVLHSGASRVRLDCSVEKDRALIAISDNGRGVTSPDGRLRPGVGLLGMSERAALIGGDVEVTSRQGRGVRILISVPIAALACEPHREEESHELDRD